MLPTWNARLAGKRPAVPEDAGAQVAALIVLLHPGKFGDAAEDGDKNALFALLRTLRPYRHRLI